MSPPSPPFPPPDLRAVSPVLPRDPSPDTKEDEVPELRPPALPEPPSSPSTAMDTEPPGSPPPPLGSPVCAPAPTEPLEDEEMEMAGGEGESPASPPGAAPHASPAPELGPFPGLPEEEEEEEEEAPRLEREGTSGSSPPLSEEDALEEGRAGGDPEAKGSPLLLEPEELGPETPMEVCAAGEKLLGRGDEAGPEPPTLRPRPDILNEISNLSQGDTSSSFPGSEPLLGSPDPEGGGSLSLELGPALADASLQKEDAASLPLGAETDDSLLFEPAAKGDGDKSRRRSSPGRSRVKQVLGDPASPSAGGTHHPPCPCGEWARAECVLGVGWGRSPLPLPGRDARRGAGWVPPGCCNSPSPLGLRVAAAASRGGDAPEVGPMGAGAGAVRA